MIGEAVVIWCNASCKRSGLKADGSASDPGGDLEGHSLFDPRVQLVAEQPVETLRGIPREIIQKLSNSL